VRYTADSFADSEQFKTDPYFGPNPATKAEHLMGQCHESLLRKYAVSLTPVRNQKWVLPPNIPLSQL